MTPFSIFNILNKKDFLLMMLKSILSANAIILITIVFLIKKNTEHLYFVKNDIPTLDLSYIGFGVLLLLVPLLQYRRVIKNYKESPISKGVEYTFSEDGVKSSTPNSERFLKWPAFVKWEERGNILLLYLDADQALYIQRSLITQEQLNFIKLKIGLAS
ncbi:MAG: YcxB family protein [Niabella sp.]|nr:YcxB family protein [Niabella sp.]